MEADDAKKAAERSAQEEAIRLAREQVRQLDPISSLTIGLTIGLRIRLRPTEPRS